MKRFQNRVIKFVSFYITRILVFALYAFDYCNLFVLYDLYLALKCISNKICFEIHFHTVLDK